MSGLSGKLKSMGKILIAMMGTTALLLFLLAVLVQRLQPGEGMISIGISAVYVISCFLGGFLAGKVQRSKKFIWGLLMGLLYLLITMIVTLISKSGFNAASGELLGNLLLCLGGGMLGGMFS